MANNGPNTNGCQFFLIYSAQPHLNNMYTIFGQVRVGVMMTMWHCNALHISVSCTFKRTHFVKQWFSTFFLRPVISSLVLP